MNYSELKTGHIFNFVDHPKDDMFLKMDNGFIRLPNKFNYDILDSGKGNFPDSIKDVIIIKSRKKIANNLTLRKE